MYYHACRRIKPSYHSTFSRKFVRIDRLRPSFFCLANLHRILKFFIPLTFLCLIIIFLPHLHIETTAQALPSIPPYNTTATTWLMYKNDVFGINIQYPSNWTNERSVSNETFVSPLENNLDRFHEYLSIVALHTKNTTLG
jgi:hypothetical protein